MRSPLIVALLVALVPVSTGRAQETPEQRNEAVYRDFVAMINARDYDRLDEFLTPGFVRHSQATPGMETLDRTGFRDFLHQDNAAVPDSRIEVVMVVAQGDLVAAWNTYTGTQTGQMGPFPPTGKRMTLDFAGFLRFEDGKIAEMWVIWDNLAGLTQLGLYPPPGAGEETDR